MENRERGTTVATSSFSFHWRLWKRLGTFDPSSLLSSILRTPSFSYLFHFCQNTTSTFLTYIGLAFHSGISICLVYLQQELRMTRRRPTSLSTKLQKIIILSITWNFYLRKFNHNFKICHFDLKTLKTGDS